jgi:hypothetical protein
MKLLILSDLPLEFAKFSPVCNGLRIDEGVDVVMLAGDIFEGTQGIRWARETFITKEVVYVLGNYDFYSGHIQLLTKQACEVASRMGAHLLERDASCTGWCAVSGHNAVDRLQFLRRTKKACRHAGRWRLPQRLPVHQYRRLKTV